MQRPALTAHVLLALQDRMLGQLLQLDVAQMRVAAATQAPPAAGNTISSNPADRSSSDNSSLRNQSIALVFALQQIAVLTASLGVLTRVRPCTWPDVEQPPAAQLPVIDPARVEQALLASAALALPLRPFQHNLKVLPVCDSIAVMRLETVMSAYLALSRQVQGAASQQAITRSSVQGRLAAQLVLDWDKLRDTLLHCLQQRTQHGSASRSAVPASTGSREPVGAGAAGAAQSESVASSSSTSSSSSRSSSRSGSSGASSSMSGSPDPSSSSGPSSKANAPASQPPSTLSACLAAAAGPRHGSVRQHHPSQDALLPGA